MDRGKPEPKPELNTSDKTKNLKSDHGQSLSESPKKIEINKEYQDFCRPGKAKLQDAG